VVGFGVGFLGSGKKFFASAKGDDGFREILWDLAVFLLGVNVGLNLALLLAKLGLF
jgi:hypothetical protein